MQCKTCRCAHLVLSVHGFVADASAFVHLAEPNHHIDKKFLPLYSCNAVLAAQCIVLCGELCRARCVPCVLPTAQPLACRHGADQRIAGMHVPTCIVIPLTDGS